MKIKRGARCTYCDRKLRDSTAPDGLRATRDHVHPRSKGGWHIVLCCFNCNCLKGDMLADEWHTWMVENPEWWITFPRHPDHKRRAAMGYLRKQGRPPTNSPRAS